MATNILPTADTYFSHYDLLRMISTNACLLICRSCMTSLFCDFCNFIRELKFYIYIALVNEIKRKLTNMNPQKSLCKLPLFALLLFVSAFFLWCSITICWNHRYYPINWLITVSILFLLPNYR